MVDDFVDFIFLVFAAVFALLFIYMALNAVTSQSEEVSAQLVEEVQIKRDLVYLFQPTATTALLKNNKEQFYQEAEKFFAKVTNDQIPNEDGFILEPLSLHLLTPEHQEQFRKRGTFDNFEVRYPETTRFSPLTDFCYKPSQQQGHSYTSIKLNLNGETKHLYYCVLQKNRKTASKKVIEGAPIIGDYDE